MARIRENSEQIALLGGEPAERAELGERYNSILANVYGVDPPAEELNWFTSFFGQFSVIFPYLLLGPAYFFGKATYGTLMQARVGLQQRAGRADLVRRQLRDARRLSRRGAATDGLRGGHARRPLRPRRRARISRRSDRHRATAFAAEGLVVSLPDRTSR